VPEPVILLQLRPGSHHRPAAQGRRSESPRRAASFTLSHRSWTWMAAQSRRSVRRGTQLVQHDREGPRRTGRSVAPVRRCGRSGSSFLRSLATRLGGVSEARTRPLPAGTALLPEGPSGAAVQVDQIDSFACVRSGSAQACRQCPGARPPPGCTASAWPRLLSRRPAVWPEAPDALRRVAWAKLRMIVWPAVVRMDSGWNWMPSVG